MYTSVAPSRSNKEQVNQHRTECIRSYRYFLSLVSLPTVRLYNPLDNRFCHIRP